MKFQHLVGGGAVAAMTIAGCANGEMPGPANRTEATIEVSPQQFAQLGQNVIRYTYETSDGGVASMDCIIEIGDEPYTVKPGDTLTDIAEEQVGLIYSDIGTQLPNKKAIAFVIADLNHISDENLIFPKQELQVPKYCDVTKA